MPAPQPRHYAFAHNLVDPLKHHGYVLAMVQHDAELDALGLLCPLPVLKARKRLQSLTSGQILRVLADDPAAVIDVPHFCSQSGHELVDIQSDGDAQVYLIRKA